jgi:hypothetical protein
MKPVHPLTMVVIIITSVSFGALLQKNIWASLFMYGLLMNYSFKNNSK